MTIRRSILTLAFLLVSGSQAHAQFRRGGNPFAAPQARVQYAPDRDYDLRHVAVTLKLDAPKQSFQGVVANTLAPLRDGLSSVALHCGSNLDVTACELNGEKATFKRDGEMLRVAAPKPLPRGEAVTVTVRYRSGTGPQRGSFMAGEGFHWIQPSPGDPDHAGFWTQGETQTNRNWVPTWDYPHDFTTSEERVTVPADWFVIGNGTLVTNTTDPGGKTRTFHWKMTQPHATYLLSLAGGPFEVKMAKWEDVPLYYVVPRGKGHLIDDSFGDTPDMLAFYSRITGVKYPWPKYAQSAMYDFGGGMENVSATTLGERNLTDRRRGFRGMASLNAHELAHQWFGDLVTCKDWGQAWLNESFATFFEALYLEHSRGRYAYDQEIEGDMQSYFSESRRYRRPIATNFYSNPDAMFDSHTYPKGAAVLHTLRRTLGDAAFFAGIHHYLTKFRHQPVTSRDLCSAITEATGVNLEPFFEQWVFKPGHPVLDTIWNWDEEKRQVVLTVRQKQETKDGTPVYDLNVTVGLLSGSNLTREKVRLTQAEQEFRLSAAGKPDAVLFDPDHDFLREIPTQHWAASELTPILRYAPNAVDRAEAMRLLLAGTPSEEAVAEVVKALQADSSQFPAFRSFARLAELKRSDLRSFYRSQLRHPDFDRRAEAVRALAQLGKDDAEIKTLRGLVNDREPYRVVRAALAALTEWDPAGSRALFQQAAAAKSGDELIRFAALDGIVAADLAEGKRQADPDPALTQSLRQLVIDLAQGKEELPLLAPGMRGGMQRRLRFMAGSLGSAEAFTLLAREEPKAGGTERRGSPVARVAHYRSSGDRGTVYLSFYLTPDGKVADLELFPTR